MTVKKKSNLQEVNLAPIKKKLHHAGLQSRSTSYAVRGRKAPRRRVTLHIAGPPTSQGCGSLAATYGRRLNLHFQSGRHRPGQQGRVQSQLLRQLSRHRSSHNLLPGVPYGTLASGTGFYNGVYHGASASGQQRAAVTRPAPTIRRRQIAPWTWKNRIWNNGSTGVWTGGHSTLEPTSRFFGPTHSSLPKRESSATKMDTIASIGSSGDARPIAWQQFPHEWSQRSPGSGDSSPKEINDLAPVSYDRARIHWGATSTRDQLEKSEDPEATKAKLESQGEQPQCHNFGFVIRRRMGRWATTEEKDGGQQQTSLASGSEKEEEGPEGLQPGGDNEQLQWLQQCHQLHGVVRSVSEGIEKLDGVTNFPRNQDANFPRDHGGRGQDTSLGSKSGDTGIGRCSNPTTGSGGFRVSASTNVGGTTGTRNTVASGATSPMDWSGQGGASSTDGVTQGGISSRPMRTVKEETIFKLNLNVRLYKILMLLAFIVSMQHFSKAEAAAPTAHFTNEGRIFIAQQIVHVPIQIPIKEVVHQCSEFYKLHHVINNRFSTPEVEKWFDVVQDVEKACGGFRLLDSQFQTDTDWSVTRQKRGVFLKGLQILRTVFGNFDAFDLRSIQKLISKFPWNHQSETKRLGQRIQRLAKKLKGVDDALQLQRINWFWRDVRSRAARIMAKANAVQDGIRLARHGKLSSGLVNITTAAQILKVVNTHLKKERGTMEATGDEMQPVARFPIEIYDCPVSIIKWKDEVKLLIHIPIAATRLKLFQHQSIPFQWQEKVVTVKPTKTLLAQNEKTSVSLNAEELSRCWQIRPRDWVCHHGIPLFNKPGPDCLSAVKASNTKDIARRCNFSPVRETTVTQLSQRFILFTPEEVTLEFQCPQEETRRESGVRGLVERELKPGCKMTSKEITIWQPHETLFPPSSVISVEWTDVNVSRLLVSDEKEVDKTKELVAKQLSFVEQDVDSNQKNLVALNIALPTSTTLLVIIMIVIVILSSVKLTRTTTAQQTNGMDTPRSSPSRPTGPSIIRNTASIGPRALHHYQVPRASPAATASLPRPAPPPPVSNATTRPKTDRPMDNIYATPGGGGSSYRMMF